MREEQREGRRPGAGKPKRRKPKETPQSRGLILAAIIGGSVLGVILVVGVIVFLVVRLSGSGKLTAPESFAVYESPEQVFRCEYPSGWTVKGSGIKNSYAVEISKSSAAIKVRESLMGSVLGDIANAGPRRPDDNDDRNSPVAIVHGGMKKKLAEEDFDNYKEGPTDFVTTGFGKVARSEFTATEGLGSKIRGYRVTALAGPTGIDVICQCSASDWEMLRPAFERIIASLGRGTGEV